MRRHLLIAVMFGAISGAQAADMPDNLRGSIPPSLSTSSVNWQGYYIGGQGGYGSADENFTGSNMFTDPLFRAMYAPNSSLLAADPIIGGSVPLSPLVFGKATARTSGYGAFAGYNSQWDDVVIGIEASYLHGDFGGSSTVIQRNTPNPLKPSLPLTDGYDQPINSIWTAAISISDMATFRARAAYVYGCFLPYVFGGFALGNAGIARTVSVLDIAIPGPVSTGPGGSAFLTNTEAQHNHLIYGYSAGLG